MIIVINNKTNEAHYNLSKTKAAEIVGVNRSTITFWQEKRIADQSFLESYRHFDVYFKTIKHLQQKGGNIQRLLSRNVVKDSNTSK